MRFIFVLTVCGSVVEVAVAADSNAWMKFPVAPVAIKQAQKPRFKNVCISARSLSRQRHKCSQFRRVMRSQNQAIAAF